MFKTQKSEKNQKGYPGPVLMAQKANRGGEGNDFKDNPGNDEKQKMGKDKRRNGTHIVRVRDIGEFTADIRATHQKAIEKIPQTHYHAKGDKNRRETVNKRLGFFHEAT